VRPLGVGLVFWPELAPLLDDTDLVGVIEIEPQGFWEKLPCGSGACYRPNEGLLRNIAQYPQPKLLHGVGQPVGGVTCDPVDATPSLRGAVDILRPVWVSEHLSFNRTYRDAAVTEAGFLLPPRQSTAGVFAAADNIVRYASMTGSPVAFETGVNYLQPRADELDDGAWFARVAEQARCGILLDLHNLWCNQRNGRERVRDVLARMPLDRVWEVHLAGGMALDGYWLDAHSDAVAPELLELAAEVVPKLPNLGAIVFEILPQHLPRIGIEGVGRQLEQLAKLWALRAPHYAVTSPATHPHPAYLATTDAHREPGRNLQELAEWENTLAAAIRGDAVNSSCFADLAQDAGIAVYRQLIGDARRSNLTRALRYTMLLLLAMLGSDETETILDRYFMTTAPDAYAALEAEGFARFLRDQSALLAGVPHLAEVLAFEHALLRASLYAEPAELAWSSDPTEIFAALDAGRLPRGLPVVRTTMRIAAQ
jgi:uncharacterized protein (UPF0276 family)